MDPALIAKLDQAGAGLRETAEIVAAMAERFIEVGAKPNQALNHAISLLIQLLWANHPVEDLDGG